MTLSRSGALDGVPATAAGTTKSLGWIFPLDCSCWGNQLMLTLLPMPGPHTPGTWELAFLREHHHCRLRAALVLL